MEHELLEISDFGKMSGSPFANSRTKKFVLNMPGASNSRNKNGFGKSSNSPNPNLHFQPFIKLFDIYGKMNLEKLITAKPI